MTVFFLRDFSLETCKILLISANILLVTQEILVGCTLALRVCVMYEFNRRLLISLGIAAVTTMSLGIVRPCLPPVATWTNSAHTGTAAAWEAQLACDILILCLTLRCAVTYHRSVGLGSGSLLRIMVRDGKSPFMVICAVNVANIVMLYIITAGSLTWFASAISVTMISRLMLNLHDAANGSFSLTFTAQCEHPEHVHELDTIRFGTSGTSPV
ncbi:hypothetical protein B0H11DRAFT_2037361 [Mycena galericulata]|nr:hypothetical protein B0H11DRAFT_2037361 [Mycena galericulata]